MQPLSDADIFRKSLQNNDLPPLSMDTNSNIVERYQQALAFGMETVNIAQFLNNQNNDDDDRLSVSDAGERSYSIYSENSVIPGKNTKLPYIIGTRAFLEDDYIGIFIKFIEFFGIYRGFYGLLLVISEVLLSFIDIY